MRARGTLLIAAAGALLAGAGLVGWEVQRLPSVDGVAERLAARLAAVPHASWAPLWAISPRLQTAVVVWEDPAFFHHRGLSWEAMRRAAFEDARTGGLERGGSTLTQQVAKNLFLTPAKSWRRKLDEAILAWRLERRFSKPQILEVYLNAAEWGEGVVGAEAAARSYFGKSAARLTWAEAALLAGILPNPRRNDPLVDPDSAGRLRRRVLVKLLDEGALSPEEFREADASPVSTAAGPDSQAPPER